MLTVHFANRLETLRNALLDRLDPAAQGPFSALQIVVPSSAMRRHLQLTIADRFSICANVDFVYLAQWLWSQIAKVVSTVARDSPFASGILVWRIDELLNDPRWLTPYPRLERYLQTPNPVVRFELAAEIAALFEQYITYRQDWLTAWERGENVSVPNLSADQRQDQAWQAELWRRLGARMGADHEHPAMRFFRELDRAQEAGESPFDLPERVHVFCLPSMPPLYLSMLGGLARWVDVRLYVLNPCREYWFDIVDPKRLRSLAVRDAAAHHDSGNRLLAQWGGQTKAYISMVVDGAGDAPVEDSGFDERFPSTVLGRLQHAVFTLTDLAPAGLAVHEADRSIEVHVCHSLTRELEVLHDQLLMMFAGPSPPLPSEILVVTPDLEAAAPLIEAVFGNAPDERKIPYSITGRGRSIVSAPARALLSILALLPSRFPASALIDMLQQPIIGRRFRIGMAELLTIQDWMRDSGMRWGIDAEHRAVHDLPRSARFTLTDGLDRLFLGYALPQQVSNPTLGRIPAGNPEGSRAAVLGLFAEFVEDLIELRSALTQPQLPDAWFASLHGIVTAFLAPEGAEIDDLSELLATLRELHGNMRRADVATPVPLSVIHTSLDTLLGGAARGGVPTGNVTFSSMSSLRHIPYRIIAVIGLNDGAFPASARPREFDLLAGDPRPGDRQRRLDDRNLFLDLVLAARDRLYLSYTGRSIRDNGVLPPSVVIAELFEALLPAVAQQPLDAAALYAARRRFVVEHPLQPFAEVYFRPDGDPRLRSFNRELCAALRHALAGHSPDPRFFAAPLSPAGPEWRSVSLERLIHFFRNPAQFLLRHRLGMFLFREEEAAADDEPFLPDHLARQALADRLLPAALEGVARAALDDLAQAGIEFPGGRLGNLLLNDEVAALQRFAAEVRAATGGECPAPTYAELDFLLEGEPWRITALLAGRREQALTLYRYDEARATDFLAAWLTHLVHCAATHPEPVETRWISRDERFHFTHCANATALLDGVMRLYRRGLHEPIHFFPKSALAYLKAGRNINSARVKWHPTHHQARGEEAHPAYGLALRGSGDPLDEDFEACADIVFGAMFDHLEGP